MAMNDNRAECSRCGACLNACAVYRLLLEEPASPRGRLATLSALREGRLENSPANRRFIDACMLCGRCEAVCNKGVKGRDDVLAIRRLWHQDRKGPWWKRLLTRFYSPRLLRLLRPCLRILALTPLRKRLLLPVSKIKHPRRLENSESTETENVIFPGCVLGVFYPGLVVQIERLLNEKNLDVTVLWEADCCGFPALSQGDLASFGRRKNRNEKLLQKKGVKTLIVPCATGVMAMQAHYEGDSVIEELGHFLLARMPQVQIHCPEVLEAADGFWLFHRSCHQPKRDESKSWLKAMADSPAIRMPWRQETDCCGFGGLFSIGFPSLSRQILQDRQDMWRQQGVGGVITDCPGCYMQFRELGTMPVLFFTELFVTGDP